MIYSFIIPGEPVPQGRPRFSRQGGFVRTHNPPKSDKYKKLVMGYAAKEAQEPLEGALVAELRFYLPIRQSWTKKRKRDCLEGAEHPTSKPDCDNLAKAVLDGCNGILYGDDSQIVSLNISKYYSEDPRVEVEFRKLGAS